MNDRHAMRYITHAECVGMGLEPYAVYGGKVYSFKDAEGNTHPHGGAIYALAVKEVEKAEQFRADMLARAAKFAGARGC